MSIRLGLHKWSLGRCTLLQAARIARALGFDYMDIGNAPDLVPTKVVGRVGEEVARINAIKAETGIAFVDAFPQIPPGFENNHPDFEERKRRRRILEAFFELAEGIGLEGVTLSPGRFWPGESEEVSFQRGAEELRWAVGEGAKRGLKVRIEPHVSSVTWTPELTLRMVREVPGLSLTLDHSHFVVHDIPYEQIAVLHPFATHWHARWAAPAQIQSTKEKNAINFQRIVADLRNRGYQGVICLENIHSTWMGSVPIDAITETLELRDHLSQWL